MAESPLKHWWREWGTMATFVASLVMAAGSVVALVLSYQANALSQQALIASDRPWFVVTGMAIEDVEEDDYYFVATVQHLSGGPALNVAFSIGLHGHQSDMHRDQAAILPSGQVILRSHRITGPKPGREDSIRWYFEFEDSAGHCYSIDQRVQLREDGLKQDGYLPGHC